MFDRLHEMENRYEELSELMGNPEVVSNLPLLQTYAREHARLGDVVARYRALRKTDAELAEAHGILGDGADEDLRELARDMVAELEPVRDEQLESLRQTLIPKDPNDEKNAIMEIRGAAGGDEAQLFAGELFRMYTLYAEAQGWKIDVLDMNESGIGGLREVIFEVAGSDAYGHLKYESGVHRVQRVPVTESGGRIHTSTASVIVLPEAEEFEFAINPDDLKIDTYRSSGHGGQGVNTTDSAVRITHLPTGLVVTCQNERSQIKNRASAMAVLRARLLDLEQERRAKELGEQRKSQVQTGDRSEKIRTYNFPQDRMTDHRINLTLHNLPSLMNGQIATVVEQLRITEQREMLQGQGL